MLKRFFIFFTVLVALIFLLEVGLRVFGFKPAADGNKAIMYVQPKDLFAYDSVYGTKMNPGHYHINQTNTQYDVTINNDGYRATSLSDSGFDALRPQIICLGGPSMFGHGANDDEICPYFLQSLLPQYKVTNLALPNSGLADNYVRLINFSGVKHGDIVVYVYHSMHDNRGRMSNLKQLSLNGSDSEFKKYRFPTLDTNLTPQLNRYHHTTIPFNSCSALANYIEMAYNHWVNEDKSSHLIAEKAILAMSNWCNAHNCKFVLVYWQPDKHRAETIEYCRKHDIKSIQFKADISFKDLVAHQPLALANKAFTDSLVNHLFTDHLIDTSISSIAPIK